MTRRLLGFGAALAAGLHLAACGEGAGDAQIERLESGVLFRNDGPELNTVDPHLANGTWTQVVTADLFTGLMRLGPDGEPAPGLAESWTVSEDGRVWTFTLRPAQWSDGRSITSQDVVYSLRRAVNPATAAVYVEVYGPVENADAIMAGEADPETLGVTALDERTVEIRLDHPMAFLPDLLADSRSAVVPRHVIEEHGQAWVQPENIVVSGAYTLVERTVNSQTVLARNPLFYDDANTCFDEVYNFPMTLPDTAARRARSGELEIAAAVPAAMLDQVRDSLPGHVQITQPPATFFLQPNARIAPFNDARVREALGISVDRVFAFEEVIPTGLSVVNALVPETLSAPYPGAAVDWADEPLQSRRARAVSLLQEAGFGPDTPLRFEFAYPSGDVTNRVAPALQNDWNSLADWVDVEIFGSESAVHYQNLGAADFEVALGGWNAVIRDASYMLDVVKQDAAGNFVGWSDPQVERLLLAARDELDPQARIALLTEAEQIALDDFAITPFYRPERAWIVHPRLTGWVGGAIEYTPSHMLCLRDADE